MGLTNEGTHQKGEQNRVLRSTKSTSPKKHTARNNLIPRSQQNRLHQRRLPKRSKKRVSRSTKSTLPQEEHCKKKFASRSPKSTSPTKAPIKREANKNQKESLKTEGQKAILYYYEIKTTPYSNKTKLKILPWLQK